MSKNNKRNSILKKPSNESSPTETFSKSDRRISFSRKNSIKEFMAGDDKATIWGTSYEESASSKDTISISDTQPVISEPRIIFPTKIPHKNIGMVLSNRKVRAVPNIKKIHVAEEDKENVNIFPEIPSNSNDINNSDMDISQEDLVAGVQIENKEITKLKENIDSVPIISTESTCSEHSNILKSEISSLLHLSNSTFNRTPAANWVLDNSLDITLSEYEKKRFRFKDKLNNNKVLLPSPLEKYNELENSQGARQNFFYRKTPPPFKECIISAENPRGAIRKEIDRNTRSEQEEINDDSNEIFFDCMDIPDEILPNTVKNVRKTMYWNETILNKTGLTKNSHTMLVDDKIEMSLLSKEHNQKGRTSSMKNKYENQPITLLDISERKPTILFEKDESLETSNGPTFQKRNPDENIDISASQAMSYQVSNVNKKSFQNENILCEISMDLEDSNILKSTPSSENVEIPSYKILNKTTNIDTEQNAKFHLNKKQKTIIYDKEEKLDTLSVTEMKPRKTFLDMSKNISQFQSDILGKYDSADLGLSILPSVSPYRNSNNMPLSESFRILDNSFQPNKKKNFVNDKTKFSELINTLRSEEFSETQSLGINKSAIKDRDAILHKTIEMSIYDNSQSPRRKIANNYDIDNSCKSEGEVELHGKRQTILFQNNDIELENLTESRVFINRNESEPKRNSTFNQKKIYMDVTNIPQEHPQLAVTADVRGIQKNRQTIMFQENIELDTMIISDNEQIQSCIPSVSMNRNEPEPKRNTAIFYQKNNAVNRGIHKMRETIMFQENNELDITNSSSNEYLQNSLSYQKPQIQNKELDSMNNPEDQIIKQPVFINEDEKILSENLLKRKNLLFDESIDIDGISDVHKSASHILSGNFKSASHSYAPKQTKNISIDKTSYTAIILPNNDIELENVLQDQPQGLIMNSNKSEQKHTIFFPENNDLDLTNVEEDSINTNKTVNSSITKNDIENLVSNQFLKRKITFSDQTDHLELSKVEKKPDLVSTNNMEFTNIISQDYAVDINYNKSNISIKLSTPIKNPNNTTILHEKNPVQTVLSTDNDLNIGDLTLNIGMKKMDNAEQSHQNKSYIDFSIVCSPRPSSRSSFNKKESNIRNKSSENSIRKTINFDCDNDLDITNKNIDEPPLRTRTASRNSTQSLGFTSNCTGHLCRDADITELTEEQQNVSTVFDRIRKSFGLSLSLDDDIENTRFNLVDDSAITVNGSLTEYLNNEKYQIQMNQDPILNQSNYKKPILEQSYCKKCEKNINRNETSLHGFTLDGNSNDELKLDFSGYDKFQDIPTIQEVMNYHEKKRQEIYDWYNSQIDSINAEESFLFPTTPSLKFIYQNIADELNKKAIAETEPDEIEPIFPLIPSVECLLKNKFKNEKLDWKINDLHLPAGILEVRHKSIRTFCLQFLFKKDNYAETTEASINFDKVLFKECPFYENWTARDLFIHNEISLKIPTNLTPSCASSPHLFTCLEYINKICKNVMLLTRELMLILIDTNATLEKDESNHCFIRKLVRKNLGTSQEIFIRINDSAKLSHSNIGLHPGPLCFNENIQSLPVGLQFVQQFLKEPSKFMKLF